MDLRCSCFRLRLDGVFGMGKGWPLTRHQVTPSPQGAREMLVTIIPLAPWGEDARRAGEGLDFLNYEQQIYDARRECSQGGCAQRYQEH